MPSRIDVTEATERLFLEIADAYNDTARNELLAINVKLQVIRPYEQALLPDREIEYQALAECWRRRDLKTLHSLITTYFERRQALLPKFVALINQTTPSPISHNRTAD